MLPIHLLELEFSETLGGSLCSLWATKFPVIKWVQGECCCSNKEESVVRETPANTGTFPGSFLVTRWLFSHKVHINIRSLSITWVSVLVNYSQLRKYLKQFWLYLNCLGTFRKQPCFEAPELQNWAQVHPVSSDRLSDVSTGDWSPFVLNSVDTTWFEKAHTCLCKFS